MSKINQLKQINAPVIAAMKAYGRATRVGYGGLTHPNSVARIHTRQGHLWAQYLVAAKIRDEAFDRLYPAAQEG